MKKSVADKVHKDVEIVKDKDGVDQVLLKNRRGYSARVRLHGGQVLSWKTNRGEELLFISRKEPSTAVREGISICFPQFGDKGSIEQHGLARKRMWVVENNRTPLHSNDSSDETYIDLLLKSSAGDPIFWPHDLEFRLRVALALDGSLALTSHITNLGSKRFSFSFAHQAYFSVSDISEVRVEGLETLHYLDNLRNGECFTEQGDASTFESEVDRVYLSSVEDIAVWDHHYMKKRIFLIKKEGLPDVDLGSLVHPSLVCGVESITDLGDDEYEHMVCVGGAAIEKPITLETDEKWTGRLKLSVKHTLKDHSISHGSCTTQSN